MTTSLLNMTTDGIDDIVVAAINDNNLTLMEYLCNYLNMKSSNLDKSKLKDYILTACINNKISYISFLYENIKIPKEYFRSPANFEEICSRGYDKLLLYFINQMNFNIHDILSGNNALLLTCVNGNVEILKILHNELDIDSRYITKEIYIQTNLANKSNVIDYLKQHLKYKPSDDNIFNTINNLNVLIDDFDDNNLHTIKLSRKIINFCKNGDLIGLINFHEKYDLPKEYYTGTKEPLTHLILYTLVENNSQSILLWYINALKITKDNFTVKDIKCASYKAIINYNREMVEIMRKYLYIPGYYFLLEIDNIIKHAISNNITHLIQYLYSEFPTHSFTITKNINTYYNSNKISFLLNYM